MHRPALFFALLCFLAGALHTPRDCQSNPYPDPRIIISWPGDPMPIRDVEAPPFLPLEVEVALIANDAGVEGFEFELVVPEYFEIWTLTLADGTTYDQPSERRFGVTLSQCRPVDGRLALAQLTLLQTSGPPGEPSEFCLANSDLGLPFDVRPTVTWCGGEPACVPLMNGESQLRAGCMGINRFSWVPIIPSVTFEILDCTETLVVPLEAVSWSSLKGRY